MACGITTQILGNWCIGDSLPIINENFEKLESSVCSLTSNAIYTTNTSTVSLSFQNVSRSLEANVNNKSITNAKLSFDESCYGFRNKLINGSFDFWQRGTSFTGINPSSILYTADRWGVLGNGNTIDITRGIFNISDSFPETTNADFFNPNYYLKLTITNAPVLTNYPKLVQRIESARTLAGRTITVSFYANATVTSGSSRLVTLNLFRRATNTDSSNSSPVTVNISANQWKKYEVTLTVPSLLVIPDNESYLELDIMPEASLGDLMITGVQLEAGTRSTAYEIRPLAVELDMCQRFFEKSYDTFTVPGSSTDENCETFFSGNNTSNFKLASRFKTTKRTKISSTNSLIYDPASTNASGQCRVNGGGPLNMVIDTNISSSKTIAFDPNGVSATAGAMLKWHYVADAEFYL